MSTADREEESDQQKYCLECFHGFLDGINAASRLSLAEPDFAGRLQSLLPPSSSSNMQSEACRELILLETGRFWVPTQDLPVQVYDSTCGGI